MLAVQLIHKATDKPIAFYRILHHFLHCFSNSKKHFIFRFLKNKERKVNYTEVLDYSDLNYSYIPFLCFLGKTTRNQHTQRAVLTFLNKTSGSTCTVMIDIYSNRASKTCLAWKTKTCFSV